MVSREDLQEANDLQIESQRIQAGLEVIKLNATITAVTLTPPQPEIPDTGNPTPDPVTVPTVGLAYPPQMITAIQQQLQVRYDEIVTRLGELGITM